MCKKITLIIAVVVLLIGVQSLIAQERDADRPRESGLRDPARSTERQPAMREPVERGDIEAGRRERAERGDQPEPEPPMAMEGRRRPAAPMAPAKTGPVQEEFGKWLDELTRAYRTDDREKMGEIIRQMQQLRQRMQTPGKVFAEPPRDYRPSPKVKKLPAGPEKKAPSQTKNSQSQPRNLLRSGKTSKVSSLAVQPAGAYARGVVGVPDVALWAASVWVWAFSKEVLADSVQRGRYRRLWISKLRRWPQRTYQGLDH